MLLHSDEFSLHTSECNIGCNVFPDAESMTLSAFCLLHPSLSDAFHGSTFSYYRSFLSHSHIFTDITCGSATVEPRQGQMLT